MALRKIPASCITCWQGFHASLPTTSTAQCGGQPSKHKASHRVAAVFIYKNTITAGGSDCGCCVVQEQIIGLHPALWLSACSCNDVTENRSHICIFFFVIFQLADYDHRLHTYVMDSIRRKRKFLPQTLWSKSEVCEEGYFYKSPFYWKNYPCYTIQIMGSFT